MKIIALKKLLAANWWWLMIAWWQLWVVQRQLRSLGVPWLMQQVEQTKLMDYEQQSVAEVVSAVRAKAEIMHESVRLAERCHPLKTACLGKSLVLVKMLRERNISAQLRIGVNLSSENLRGQNQADSLAPLLASHAWVELAGVPVGESADMRKEFVELVR